MNPRGNNREVVEDDALAAALPPCREASSQLWDADTYRTRSLESYSALRRARQVSGVR